MSRKLWLLYVVIILATVGAFVPPIISWACAMAGSKAVPPFEILGSTEWVTMISLVVSTYFGANVMEKNVALKNGIMPKDIDDACRQAKGSPGATQVNVQINNDADTGNDPDKDAIKDALKHGQ